MAEEKWGIELTPNPPKAQGTSDGDENSKKSLSSVMGLLGINEILPSKNKDDDDDDEKASNAGQADGSSILGDLKSKAGSGGDSISSAFFEDYSVHQAAREGVLSAVKEQIENLKNKGVDVFRIIDHLDNEGFSPLHHAAKFNRAEVTEYLLELGAYIDIVGDEHNTPLHLASRYTSNDAAKLLMQGSANAALKNIYGSTALHFAARRGSTEIAGLLVQQRGVDVNAKDNALLTPLHQACLGGHLNIVKLLLKEGADIHAKDVEGDSVLHAAGGEGFEDVIKFLIETVVEKSVDSSHADIARMNFVNDANNELDTPLHVASQGGYEEAVKVLLNNGANVNAKTDTSTAPIHLAASSGHIKVARALLNSGGKINAKDQDQMTPLHRASLFGRVELIPHLLQRGALINAKDKDNYTPLLCAVWKGQTEAVKILLKKGAKIYFVDSSLKSCIHLAIEFSHIEILELLLSSGGIDLINSSDKDYRTPLHYAAQTGHMKAIKILIENNVNLDVSDCEEKTPLHIAAQNGKAHCAKMIGQAQPGILNATDERGRTPLHVASMKGHVKVVKILLEMGAEIASRDDVNWTPLDHASRNGFHKTMQVLLDNDAPIDACDKNLNTPLHLAAWYGHVDALILLFDNGADISLRNNEGKNCLDLAVEHYQKDVCMALVKHDRWKEIMGNLDAENRQPMQKLIEVAPEVAEVVLDKCIDYSKHHRSHPDFTVTYNFQYLDVHPDLQPEPRRGKRYFGPKSMVEHKRQKLLSHTVSQKLIDVKWKRIGRGGYYFSFLIYATFVGLVTAFAIVEKQSFLKGNFFGKSDSTFKDVVPFLAVVMCGIQIIKEIIQWWALGFRYLTDPNNIMEWLLYVSTVIFMLPFAINTTSQTFTDIRWHAGAISILFTWINLLLYLRRFPFFGLYVVMFVEVFKTVIRVLLVFSIFIIAFALSFYLLLARERTFGNVPRSLMKTLVMTIGEMEYDNILTEQLFVGSGNDAIIPYPVITYLMFVGFIVLMPIIIMNLLVGLAVGDIESVRKSAYLRILEQQVDILRDLEKNFPKVFLRWAYKSSYVVKPNDTHWSAKMLRFLGIGVSNQYEFLLEENTKESTKEDILINELATHKAELSKQKKRMKGLYSILDEQNEVLKQMATKMGISLDKEENRDKFDI